MELNEVKTYIRAEEESDETVAALMAGALSMIEKGTGLTAEQITGDAVGRLAVKMLTGFFYDNRAAEGGTGAAPVPFTIIALIKQIGATIEPAGENPQGEEKTADTGEI